MQDTTSAGKVTASVLWDAHRIIFIDYLKSDKTINSDYYFGLLDLLMYNLARNLLMYLIIYFQHIDILFDVSLKDNRNIFHP